MTVETPQEAGVNVRDDGAALLRIDVVGELAVSRSGRPLPLPPSKKTRALLAYLALNPRPQRRDWLCEFLWELPDDPRGALRWSLSRLRRALAPGADSVVAADRERIWIDAEAIELDLSAMRALADRGPAADRQAVQAAAARLREPLLAGLDLPQQPSYQAWLTAERDAAGTIRTRLLATLAGQLRDSPAEALPWLREWIEAEPCEAAPASALDAALRRLGRAQEADVAERRYRAEAMSAGLTPAPLGAAADPPVSQPPPLLRLVDRQKVGFCPAANGTRIAYAVVGSGPPLVKAANWLNHLELDWDAPIWAPLFRELARDHSFTRYDERGNGLSDWDVEDLSFDSFVSDLEAVVAATGVKRFPLLGISQGCAVAIEYAARHPDKVSHLILWGGYAAGWRVDASPELRAEREAIITLVRQGWGREDPVYRHIFSASFMPNATPEEMRWFNEFQRRTTSAGNAARFLDVFADIDVRPRLQAVAAPTLVMHARGDRRIPVSSAAELAAAIPSAEFVALDGNNHILLGREPASAEFVAQVRQFIAQG